MTGKSTYIMAKRLKKAFYCLHNSLEIITLILCSHHHYTSWKLL